MIYKKTLENQIITKLNIPFGHSLFTILMNEIQKKLHDNFKNSVKLIKKNLQQEIFQRRKKS
jgi:hypothetical protein